MPTDWVYSLRVVKRKISASMTPINTTPNTGVGRDIRVAVSTSLGFGGHNGALVFKAAQ
jgi:3-oxoacyl-(acyl-carrier-protein) synthase